MANEAKLDADECPYWGSFGHVHGGPSYDRKPCVCGEPFERSPQPALDKTQAAVLEQEIERLRSYRDHHESRLHPDDEDRSMIALYQKLIHTLIGLRNCNCDASTDGNHARTCAKRGL
jgi:hypothetical protein